MNKTRAAGAAIVSLTLTATVALAASPRSQAPTGAAAAGAAHAGAVAISALAQDHAAVGGLNDNHGGAVSALARSSHGKPDTSTDTTKTGATDEDGAHGGLGAAVSAVAQNHDAVGGKNNNHGGAVSAAARGTHGATATHVKSAGKSQAGTHPEDNETSDVDQ